MKALRWYGATDMRLEDIDKPKLVEPDDAVLRVTTAAICGSDLHLYHGKVPKYRIITERVALEEVPDAYRRLDAQETTKVVISP